MDNEGYHKSYATRIIMSL